MGVSAIPLSLDGGPREARLRTTSPIAVTWTALPGTVRGKLGRRIATSLRTYGAQPRRHRVADVTGSRKWRRRTRIHWLRKRRAADHYRTAGTELAAEPSCGSVLERAAPTR